MLSRRDETDSGVVDKHVRASIEIEDLLGESFYRSFVYNVAGAADCLAPLCRNGVQGFRRQTQIYDREPVASFGKQLRSAPTNALRTSGDDCYPFVPADIWIHERIIADDAKLRDVANSMVTLSDLRHHAIGSSLFPETTLRRAVNKLGFVQADPIRSPARAQDLILRQRVTDYRVGDLDRRYRNLKLEEDLLYAYGFMPVTTWRLLHPRGQRELTVAEQRVLDIVSNSKNVHPRELEAHLGRKRESNAWGGYSKSTTRCLEKLHYLGLIRIAHREKGIKLYERTASTHEAMSPDDRLRKLAMLIASILAPAPESSLRATLQRLRYAAPDLQGRKSVITSLLKTGELVSTEVDGIRYLRPAGQLIRKEPGEIVRFLAPFDPLVWDRRRFENFWGWPYRFEAYTPPPKRKLGYYAMPLLWRADVIGWVNISGSGNELTINPGFLRGKQPIEKSFRNAFEAESERMRWFLSATESRIG